ncbi:sugar ABC transporter ATP-binding protein [Treponema sp. OMZ 840]|uniref:sugar ABC transporter ATP-binding protein n=1 Tax=Treponema sp. OMZ 840 TaxID=244313 RepID=UPI003D94F553
MSDYVVKMENICKTFPGVKALDNVSLHLKAGRVMALLGENGAGKSTLMKVLSGIYPYDSGNITLFGKPIGNLNPNSAKEKGIAIIHQELNLCQHLTVAENIFLGREKCKQKFIIDNAAIQREAAAILTKLGCDITVNTLVGDLPISKQQMVEIAKALSLNAKVLIMDEPTSALSTREIKELFAIITQLKNEGCAIVYISHRLEELKYIADDVTIMRDGKFITSGLFNDFNIETIITNMVGRTIKEKYPRITCPIGKTILEVQDLYSKTMMQKVSFSINEGEIVGIAGLMGAGRTEMVRTLFGMDHAESGKIFLDGKEINIRKPLDAIKQGIVLVPEDRKKYGLCTKLPVRDNIALPNLDLLCNKIEAVNQRKEANLIAKCINNLHIKVSGPEVAAKTLSGGNQQKVVVAKWMGRPFRIVIFDEPTRGIDVAAKVEIYNLMNELKKKGVGVLFISSEMPEIIGFADRILVMCEGRITGELSGTNITQEKILTLATHFKSKLAV